MDDQRLTSRLLDYWEMIRQNHKIPEIQTFNTATVEDVWPQCLMISLDTRSGLAYKYEYVGPNIATIYGKDLTGMTIDHKTKQFPGAVIFKKLELVVNNKQPLQDQGHLVNPEGKMVKYRACFLPFGSDKKGLTHIVVGLSFRVY